MLSGTIYLLTMALSMYINENEDVQGKVRLLYSLDKHNYGSWFQAFSGESSEFVFMEDKTQDEIIKKLDKRKEEFSFGVLLKQSALYGILEKYVEAYEKIWADDYVVMYKF